MDSTEDEEINNQEIKVDLLSEKIHRIPFRRHFNKHCQIKIIKKELLIRLC